MNAHPSIKTDIHKRWRLIKDGGDDFIDEFLTQRLSEDPTDFSARADLAYDPATASSAVDDVINSMAARLDINRSGGSDEYQNCVAGRLGGVDRDGSSMNDFIIRNTLPELCYMQKVCWVVQNFTDPNDTRKFPWIKQYTAEEVFNWTYKDGKLIALALKYKAQSLNPDTGFANDSEIDVVRVFRLLEGRVETWLQTPDDQELDVNTLQAGSSRQFIEIDEIPAFIFALPIGLLTKIDKMQIAALNLESADVDWLRTGNKTIYVEQGMGFHPAMITKAEDGTVEEDKVEIKLGTNSGRMYGQGMAQPAFINPSADPLRASMEKQNHINNRVKDILKTTLSDMKLASADALSIMGQGMESGLYGIGTVLLIGELAFARIFHKYLNRGEVEVTVAYPKKYELRTEEDRINKSEKIKTISQTFGSNTAKKYLELQAVYTLLDGKIPFEELKKIESEILNSEFCIYDPVTIESLVQAGIISRSLAGTSIGAPENDSKDAEAEHIRRIVAVQVAQTSGTGSLNPDPKLTEDVRKEAALEVRDSGIG